MFRSNKISPFIFLIGLFIFYSCNTTKKLKDGEFLLEGSRINNYKETGIDLEEFQAFEKQKPNRKFLKVIPFYVWWYNLYNDSVIQIKKEERNLRFDKKNAKRISKANKKNSKRREKGKQPLIPKLLNKDEPIMRESIRGIGEAPVLFDTVLANQTARQLRKFLFNKGFFDNRVDWCVDINEKNMFGKIKKHKAFLNYHLQPNSAYYISEFHYNIQDTGMIRQFYEDTINCVIKRGARYDSDKLQEERERITRYFLDKGYYYFENGHVTYNVDTNLAGNYVAVELVLRKFARNYSSANDSIVFVNHTKYKINEIYVITEPVVGKIKDVYFKDTTRAKGYDFIFLHNYPMQYKASLLAGFIKLRKGAYFNRDTAEATFKSLVGIGVFKGVTIQFEKSDEFPKKLDCYIICTPLIKQSITAETEGINTFGNLGIDGSIIYRNKNVFKGGEIIQFKIQGALTAQSQLGGEKDQDITSLSKIQQLFNTFQFGPELSFSVPRAFFPFSLLPFKNEMAPRTYFKASVNYQARSTFVRNIVSFENGLSFKSRNRLFNYYFVPFEIYSVTADLTTSFKNQLNQLNDAFLLNSFIDHITTLSKFSVNYSSRQNFVSATVPVTFVKWDIMSSGNILREFYKLNGRTPDSLGRYTILGVPFAHFVKSSLEFKLYIPINKKSKLVYRVAGGIGWTLKNLNVLPYEQSFFAGGPNSVRAWRARTLGPGGYDPTNSAAKFDKIGDILLEGNIEYRFHIVKSFYGALFGDAGNIWRREKVLDKPDGEFRPDEFYKQIAMGGGIGIRWDLDFLILRFDFAMPIKDPKYPEGDRFTFNKQPWRSTVINFGIGYPF